MHACQLKFHASSIGILLDAVAVISVNTLLLFTCVHGDAGEEGLQHRDAFAQDVGVYQGRLERVGAPAQVNVHHLL